MRNKLRITVGTPEENEQLMKALRFIAGLKQTPQNDLSRCNGRPKGGNSIQRLAQFGAVACSAERASRSHLHYCRDKLHAIATQR